MERADGSVYACMGGDNIEDVKERAPIGIMSEARVAGGLPVPDNDVPETEGESEYARPSFESEGTFIDAGIRL